MKFEMLNGAGRRVTDGSTLALAVCAAASPIIAMLPNGREMNAQELALVAVAVVGMVFKFIKVTW